MSDLGRALHAIDRRLSQAHRHDEQANGGSYGHMALRVVDTVLERFIKCLVCKTLVSDFLLGRKPLELPKVLCQPVLMLSYRSVLYSSNVGQKPWFVPMKLFTAV